MNKLNKLRGKNGWSQKDLALKLGVSRQTVNNLEKNGKCNPNLITRVCELFEITPCDLLGYDNLLYKPQSKEEFERFIELLKKEYNNEYGNN